jgi:dienelactone hydrolase
MRRHRRASSCFAALAVAFFVAASRPTAGAQDALPFSEVYYQSGPLKIQAYLFKPAGAGPFPAVIYNHGSRALRERASVPMQFVGEMLAQAGFAVLVPERRGYGKSDGIPYSEDVRGSGPQMIARLQAESDDVLAAVAYLRTVPFVDGQRLGIMGWSFGGIVTIFATSRSDAFKVAVDQAGGALSWNGSAALRSALTAAAGKTKIPVLVMDARNDATTQAAVAVDAALRRAGTPSKLIVYDSFSPPNNLFNVAPGHLLFGADGIRIWQADVLAWLRTYL